MATEAANVSFGVDVRAKATSCMASYFSSSSPSSSSSSPSSSSSFLSSFSASAPSTSSPLCHPGPRPSPSPSPSPSPLRSRVGSGPSRVRKGTGKDKEKSRARALLPPSRNGHAAAGAAAGAGPRRAALRPQPWPRSLDLQVGALLIASWMPVVAAEDSNAKTVVLVILIAVVGLVAVSVWALIWNDRGQEERWLKPQPQDDESNSREEDDKKPTTKTASAEANKDKDLEAGLETAAAAPVATPLKEDVDVVPSEGRVASLQNLVLFSFSEGPQRKLPSLCRGTQ